ncbi:MAG: HAD family hydrolase [Proteobacteria bacterium]|nr:MAG: HAD family hydrolase [Pseudomonadota bacterium]
MEPGPKTKARVAYPRRIFCNRNLRLDKIRFVGFDMDYTLALYEEAMEFLQAEMVLERLVDRYGYGREVLGAAYEPGFAVRGLAVDKAHGNVFKMDAHRFVGRVWHGPGPLDRGKRRDTYTNRIISPADPSIVMVDTLFALPEINLYCQLVERLDDTVADPNYERLWSDLREAMDSLHRDGTLKAKILADIPRYIRRDPDLSEMLHGFRAAGKTLFLLTNSEASYTEAVMAYLLDDPASGYASWRDRFDIIVTAAMKPMFFSSQVPLREVAEDFSLRDAPVTRLERGTMYAGGSVRQLSRIAGLQGDDVLYVGDHIYGDILRSKRAMGWRTAMVVPEMERELERALAVGDALDELAELEETRFQLNLDRAAARRNGQRADGLERIIGDLTSKIAELDRATSGHFNPYWGALFRDRAELSAFGAQVEDYACVYTSRASNFAYYSPSWYFRSPRDRMAHELRR